MKYKIKRDPAFAEAGRRRAQEMAIRGRRVNTLAASVMLSALVLHVRWHGWGWVAWLLLADLLLFAPVAALGWWLWWRQAHPDGARLVIRRWGVTGAGALPDAPPPADPEHVWPPAPRRPD